MLSALTIANQKLVEAIPTNNKNSPINPEVNGNAILAILKIKKQVVIIGIMVAKPPK